jgi:hypothetical protein
MGLRMTITGLCGRQTQKQGGCSSLPAIGGEVMHDSPPPNPSPSPQMFGPGGFQAPEWPLPRFFPARQPQVPFLC